MSAQIKRIGVITSGGDCQAMNAAVRAVVLSARKYNIEVVESENNPQQKQELQHREELYALNNWANDFFQNSLYNTEEGQ